MAKVINYDFYAVGEKQLNDEANELFKELFPICRSITGDGVRQSLSRLQEVISFEMREITSGTVCYDWVIPDEWNIRDAYIMDSQKNKIIDFSKSNIHIVSYSSSIDKKMSFKELKSHLYYLSDLPTAIPYRTAYYKRDWGFCLSYEQFKKMDKNGEYHVYIDSTIAPGTLNYGEGIIKGQSGQEYIVSTYCCHPSLANDNLSGLILWAFLLRELKTRKTRHSYRFVILPETIGAIAYLWMNEKLMKRILGGFILTTVAGPGKFSYKQTFRENDLIDRVVEKTFSELQIEYIAYRFDIYGSDESQYSAPFFRIPVGSICKDKYYEYDYYHTSLDDLNFVNSRWLIETLKIYLLSIEKLEMNLAYKSLNPYCEPMLGKRDLYPQIGGNIKQGFVSSQKKHSKKKYKISNEKSIYGNELDAISWIMFYSDGKTTLLDIAEKTNLPLVQIFKVAEKLRNHGLLKYSSTIATVI